jgi:hypothetical protein
VPCAHFGRFAWLCAGHVRHLPVHPSAVTLHRAFCHGLPCTCRCLPDHLAPVLGSPLRRPCAPSTSPPYGSHLTRSILSWSALCLPQSTSRLVEDADAWFTLNLPPSPQRLPPSTMDLPQAILHLPSPSPPGACRGPSCTVYCRFTLRLFAAHLVPGTVQLVQGSPCNAFQTVPSTWHRPACARCSPMIQIHPVPASVHPVLQTCRHPPCANHLSADPTASARSCACRRPP